MSVRAMNWAIEAAKGSRLTSSERLVLMILAHHHHDRTNACFPSVATLAEVAGLSVRRVQITLRSLADKGLISVAIRTEHGRQRSNQYDLFGPMRGDASVAPKPVTRGDAHFTPKRSTRGDGGDAPQNNRGVTLASPDRDSIPDRAERLPTEIIAFPRTVGGN
ncbi:helix-turn-helix domain-containing protein [Fluviibacterium sp. S390]|uniref:helix-turn-helix domain-containing protein n=1 Tax=Fluviibacterium sp. S390 TaxID=3415139 RepID=UPI003C7B8751